VLNGANAALLGSEILQFKTATLVAPGQYRLSGLLRGRLGTEWAVGTHAIGDRFVLLDGRLSRKPVSGSITGLPRLYKAVTFGSTLSGATAQSFTYNAVALKPYSPASVAAMRDGSANIMLSWKRRTRIGGDWQDHVDVPLGEESEQYEVDILDGSDVVRTIRGLTSAAASYTAAQQVSDFGGTQASLTVRVYQLSAQVGRGYAAQATV